MIQNRSRGPLHVLAACLSTFAATAIGAGGADEPPPPTADTDIIALAPAADPHVLELALGAMACAQSEGVGVDASRLAVIDYSRSSLRPRLWVFDLSARRLLYEDVVAHGQGSGGDVPD